jgi:Tfp pilus assembly protein PilO
VKTGNTAFHVNALVISATLVLVAGLAVDFFVVTPGLGEVQSLNDQRLQLMKNNETNLALSREINQLKTLLKVDSLNDLDDLNIVDPIAYVGLKLADTRLQRIEITTGESAVAGKLRSTRISVRVRGRYTDIVTFVRSLEMGVRLVTLDDLDVEQLELDNRLEARLNLTVLDPAGRG